MKRKIIAAIFTGMLTTALCPSIAGAEIENPEDYMGVWYANYVIYSDESSERHNVGISESVHGIETDGGRKGLC